MALKKNRGSNKTKGLCKLSIDNDMTIYSIDDLKNDFSKEIEVYKEFEINLSDVEEIDSSGIQLLLALKNELMKNEKKFKITAVSGPVEKLIERYGLAECFNAEVLA